MNTFVQSGKRLALLVVFLAVMLLPGACGLSTSSTSNALLSTPQQTIPSVISPTPQLTQVYRFTEEDSGKVATYVITSRMSIILNEEKYPRADSKLSCQPTGVLGGVSNTPSVESPLYAVTYEAVQPGRCTFKNGSFVLTVKVIVQSR